MWGVRDWGIVCIWGTGSVWTDGWGHSSEKPRQVGHCHKKAGLTAGPLGQDEATAPEGLKPRQVLQPGTHLMPLFPDWGRELGGLWGEVGAANETGS